MKIFVSKNHQSYNPYFATYFILFDHLF